MRKNRTHWLFWIAVIAFIAMIAVPTCNAQIPKDKQDHIIAGALIGTTSTFMTINQPPLKSLGVTLGSVVVIGGVGKELIYDKWMGKGVASWSDFGADVIGSLAGWGLVTTFKLLPHKHVKRNNYTGMVFGNTKLNNK